MSFLVKTRSGERILCDKIIFSKPGESTQQQVYLIIDHRPTQLEIIEGKPDVEVVTVSNTEISTITESPASDDTLDFMIELEIDEVVIPAELDEDETFKDAYV